MTSVYRVLWLCKARYMNHDVIQDRYGRLFELPQGLSKKLVVFAFCLDYRPRRLQPVAVDLQKGWRRSNLPRTFYVGWIFSLLNCARKVRPDCVIASSDCLHIILGAVVSRLYGTTFYADLYDDYSTFGLAKIPGMRWLYDKALARADGICVVSQTLGLDIQQQFPLTPVLVLESTIDSTLFYSRDKLESRRLLGLEHLEGKKLVGVCGGLNALHGADVMFQAFAGMLKRDANVAFVVAGKLYDDCPLPEGVAIEYLGMLPHARMPYFFSAMDVVLVSLSNTRFGYYAFPQKAYEIMACKVPVVAANVGALALLFTDAKEALYDPNSSDSLVDTVILQLEQRVILNVAIPSWDVQAEKLCEFIQGRPVS
jgi:teichuronic acid biosynthesis glycosyltransferase TuaC